MENAEIRRFCHGGGGGPHRMRCTVIQKEKESGVVPDKFKGDKPSFPLFPKEIGGGMGLNS